ncbi:MAG: hypothetical protein Q4C49_09625 [Bacillota bacterium]|nr:hypothetical protein [Bacillota bacterium]
MNKRKWMALLLGATISLWGCNTVLLAKQNAIKLINEKDKTSFAYKVHESEEAYEASLNERMSRVYDQLQGHIQKKNICPIPGLIRTCYENNGKEVNSTFYTPQGICRAGDYILVTAYYDSSTGGKNKEMRGILYVLDAKSHEYLGTLSLPQNYHNGGIACDGTNVWFCGNTGNGYFKQGNKPFVQYMKLSRLQEYVEDIQGSEKDYTAIAPQDFSEELYIDNKPSFLECDNGILWVGTYVNNKPDDNKGYAIGYPIEGKDSLWTSLDTLDVYRMNGLPSAQQGMDIDGDIVYISSSGFGGENMVKSSFVSTYNISKLKEENRLIDLNGEFLKRVEVPKMNEELMVDDTSVYLVFEACSDGFMKCMPQGMKTDRILPLDKSLWE